MKMMVPFANFPVRPYMETGESLAGYIHRFLVANGHRMTKDIYVALRALYCGTPRSEVTAFETLQSMIGESEILNRSWWLERPALKRYAWDHRHDWFYFSLGAPSFCPACLKDSGFHFALWELPLVKACPQHQCALIRACNTCLRTFDWLNGSPTWLCVCGVPIEKMPLQPIEPGALYIAQVIAESSDLILPVPYQEHFVKPEHGQYRLEKVYRRLEFATTLCEFTRRPPVRKSNYWQPQTINRWDRCGSRESKLFSHTTEQLIYRLIRAKKKRFKGKQLLHFALPTDAQKYAFNSGPGVLQIKTRKTLNRYLGDYALDLGSALFIWFYGNNLFERTVYMRHFAIWWTDPACRIKDIDTAMQHDVLTAPPQAVAKRFLPAEIMAVSILNLLLDAPSQDIHLEKFSELINRWHIPAVLRDVSDFDELFRRIGLHLLAGPEEEITFVLDLIQSGYKN